MRPSGQAIDDGRGSAKLIERIAKFLAKEAAERARAKRARPKKR